MKNKILLLIAVATLGLTATTLAQVPSYVPSNGLVGYWPFNGNANDESGNGNNGTVNGATLTTDRNGNANKAYSFDGVDDYIFIVNSLLAASETSFSISIWVNPNIFFNNYSELMCDRGTLTYAHKYRISIADNGATSQPATFYCLMGDGLGETHCYDTTYLNLNLWSHYIVVFNSVLGEMRTYKNGNLTDVNPSSGVGSGYPNQTTPTYIGKSISPAGFDYGFHGLIDDIGIWNRALTQQEITALYNGCQLAVNTQPVSQTININNNAQFIVGSSDTNATYQWQTDLGVGFQNVSNTGQYNGTSNDTLSVANVSMSNNNQSFRCIINSGSCADTSNVAVLTINNNVGIHEIAQHNLFSVFPNPAHNVINVKADHKLIGSVFTIYDNTGKAVQSGKINAANTSIELSNLSSGFYMFSLGENRKQSFKIIKE